MMSEPGELGSLVVCWFDPGITTGYGLVRVPMKRLMMDGQVGSIRHTVVKCGQFNFAGDTSASVDRALAIARTTYEQVCEDDDVFVIGSEGFQLRLMNSDPEMLEPVRFNAVLDDRLRGTGMVREEQGPSEAKRTITDDRLRTWGMWHTSDHARDGLRHCLLFLRRWSSQRGLRERYEGLEVGRAA